eukprot:gnl/TRDRNA2_/TRDRNA2_152629_c0_seq2.p1 gnl/TRDRNA2_/TRDRNA2_152629_c0~~gnl/TRDRNA2_/TRDRNA2_152629_c0_seq2.p1  ORF type:complete len:212 (+),score=74.69 gnl/TRDRNA2_/TRDRNA2_152629_c0_seq2:169-804(+)
MQASTKIALGVFLALVAFQLHGCDQCAFDAKSAASEALAEGYAAAVEACNDEIPGDKASDVLATHRCTIEKQTAVSEAVQETEKAMLDACQKKSLPEGKELKKEEEEEGEKEAEELKKAEKKEEEKEAEEEGEKEDAAENATKLYAKLDIKKSIQTKFSMKQNVFGSLTMVCGAIAGCTLLAVAAAGFALSKRKPSANNSDEQELIHRDIE